MSLATIYSEVKTRLLGITPLNFTITPFHVDNAVRTPITFAETLSAVSIEFPRTKNTNFTRNQDEIYCEDQMHVRLAFNMKVNHADSYALLLAIEDQIRERLTDTSWTPTGVCTIRLLEVTRGYDPRNPQAYYQVDQIFSLSRSDTLGG